MTLICVIRGNFKSTAISEDVVFCRCHGKPKQCAIKKINARMAS